MRKYNTSEKGRAKRIAYEKTDKCKALRAKYQKTPKMRYWQYKSSAKRRGIVMELTFEQFMAYWNKPCHYCGDAIETIGLDRIDSHKGYTQDNIVPCCEFCNKSKLDHTKEEFIAHCYRVVERDRVVQKLYNL